MQPGITSSRKISNSHQTVIESAIPLLKTLKKRDCIEKIVIGKVMQKSSKEKRVIASDTGTSIRLIVKGRGELQEFYLIGNNLKHIKNSIRDVTDIWR